MDNICRELSISSKNVFPTALPDLFTVVVHSSWLKQWMKKVETDNTVNNVDIIIEPGENVPYPWRKIFIKVVNKKVAKVLPLPRSKCSDTAPESPLTFSQLLQYVSHTNQRTLWKESYKKYSQNRDTFKDNTIVNLLEHDQLLSEVILRLYGCNIIRLKHDNTGKPIEYKEFIASKVPKSYKTNVNLLAALFSFETDSAFYVVYGSHYEHNLLKCLNFSPAVINKNYSRGLFLIYQLLRVSKAMSDRGLSLGELELHDIYLSDNLWLQIVPPITNNVHTVNPSLVWEYNCSRQLGANVQSHIPQSKREDSGRDAMVQLEKLCMLWVRGWITNLDYLLHLNRMAGRSASDPQAHYMVPWVTDFTSRCGSNWRDLSKSKYRLNKGDRQLDLTYQTACREQIPHHVTDALTDITCYVYLARRTPKEVLCAHVRNKWVPAEYPASIQRMQQWTPDECIPEFYTDPTVFKSIHEDLPDLGIPSWATCVEDFITKHREALESSHVSDNLHHWIDITFGYKLSGQAAVKAKNVCLSLVEGGADGSTPVLRGGGVVQLWGVAHPPRGARPPPRAPPRLRWTNTRDKKLAKVESSDECSEEEESSSAHHVSRLDRCRARSLTKGQERAATGQERALTKGTGQEARASSHSRHYRVQRSELGKGVIYLPKEFNPIATLQALESQHTFRTKCFFSKVHDDEMLTDNLSSLKRFPINPEVTQSAKDSNDTAFTNHMFLASHDHNFFKRFSQDAHLPVDSVLKDRKNRTFNNRYTTEAAVYKQAVTESRRRDMMLVGCLVVEIFLYKYIRPLRTHTNFMERYNNCRTVLRHNLNSLPKCVGYIACLLLNVQRPSFSSNNDSVSNDEEAIPATSVTDKGLPAPIPSQLLQPLLMQHLIPFPQTFNTLYKLLSTLHEYELTSSELNILCNYECDGVQCEKYQNADKTKHEYAPKIAEGKVQACVMYLDILLNQVQGQFEVLDLFLPHYIELLTNQDTSVLAAWYLFDTVSKALGPAETRSKLLKHILNLYEDDYLVCDKPEPNKATDPPNASLSGRHKFIKLYHHIFLLQLMVRFGLQCFLDHFVQHLVEAVGGYKDVATSLGQPGHACRSRAMANKKPRCSDDSVQQALCPADAAADIFSPDTSYGSEHASTPTLDRSITINDTAKERDPDNKSENEMFLFESDKERSVSRSKSPAESIDSCASNPPQDVTSPATLESPMSTKCFTSNTTRSDVSMTEEETCAGPLEPRAAMSPTIDIPNRPMFTSYLHFADDDDKCDPVEMRSESRARQVKSLDIKGDATNAPNASSSLNERVYSPLEVNDCQISDMSVESVIWLAHRLGPVLTCRHITRNLLKMLTLCYVGKENLEPYDGEDKDEFEQMAIVDSRVHGDKNAAKVIRCLTAIVAMYGEQVVVLQYLPHMSEVIAACRKRQSAALQGGVLASAGLVARLLPCVSEPTLMDQLQDTFVKSIIVPSLRLAGSARAPFPRMVAARKLLCALHALAVRVGPEMTRRHLCVPALQRFFLAFDKATGNTDDWPKQDDSDTDKNVWEESREEGFPEQCRDGSTSEWSREGRVLPPPPPPPRCRQAQEELQAAFSCELAYHAYRTFERFIGTDALRRCLANARTVDRLCQLYAATATHANSSPIPVGGHHRQSDSELRPPSGGCVLAPAHAQSPRWSPAGAADHSPIADHSTSNSFGSNVTLVGNRIEINDLSPGAPHGHGSGFDAVAYRPDSYIDTNRHLRGSWLVYWEHELGRPSQPRRFQLKQMRLQTFAGHAHAVKAVHCLPGESGFMTASKDKTVRLWSLRNQGDGSASSSSSWTYHGHRRGVLSLSFVESLRLAVSTDSVLHVWDPFMETVVSQLDGMKSAVSLVSALPGPSSAVLAATADHMVKVIDLRAPHAPLDLKLPVSSPMVVRCVCVESGGRWAAVGLGGGMVAVLELRGTGAPTVWRGHDNEVVRVVAIDGQRLVSSGLDLVTALWRTDGELLAHFKGHGEPVHCLCVYASELICGTTNNRISVHSGLEPGGESSGSGGNSSSARLRADTFRGVLTALEVLPLHRLLLLGSDSGAVTLLC